MNRLPVGAAVVLLQIAILGANPDHVVQGVREVGADEVAVVGPPSARSAFDDVARELSELDVPAGFHEVAGDVLLGTIRTVRDLSQSARERKKDVVLNIGGADRTLTCAGLSSGFVAGVRSFDVVDGRIVHLPVLRFSYEEIVGPEKIAVLQALHALGGSVENVNELAAQAGLPGSKVTYHLRGGQEGPGLEELGLVRIIRPEGAGVRIELTEMGKTLAAGTATPT